MIFGKIGLISSKYQKLSNGLEGDWAIKTKIQSKLEPLYQVLITSLDDLITAKKILDLKHRSSVEEKNLASLLIYDAEYSQYDYQMWAN